MIKNGKLNSTTAIQEQLLDYSKKSIQKIMQEFGSSLNGMDAKAVEKNREKYGINEIAHEKTPAWYVQLFKAFLNPFIGILLVLIAVSFVTDVALAEPGEQQYKTVVVLSIMIISSAMIRFIQEYRSNKAAEHLKSLIKTTAAVVRAETGRQEIPLEDIVPGDIIQLAAGDMIPGDVRLISSKDLFVSQSGLTGESEPIEKSEKFKLGQSAAVTDIPNICFMGTNVVSGTATAIVLATGNNTYWGSMAKSLVGKRVQTSFDKGINSVSWLLIRFMLVMVPVVFFINGFTKGDWLDAFLFGISIAVGLTPEMLPMIVTTNLAKGAVAMAKRKTVVKRLHSIQNFGAMDILCTDKTGTLTIDKIILQRHLDIHGNEDDRVLRHAYLNSYFQTGLKNLMDVAILSYGDEKGLSQKVDIYQKVDEIPFDFNRRRMSVVLASVDKQKRQLITKGAVEEILSICSHAEYQGNIVPLTEEIKKEALSMVKRLNQDGMRVIAVAQKNEIPDETVFSVKDESDMVLMGWLAFLDPPKDSAVEAIKALKENGVSVKILTGDNEFVTKKICKEIGLQVNATLLGPEIDHMSDEHLAEAAEKTTVFAKLTPMQKARIIEVLQQKGHTVGFLGDGINDAPALRQADVGISVDTAVDIAKESADIILLEKNLMVLEEGIIEGRKTYGNIIKYIKMAASSNFGNMFSVLPASAFLPFLPMLPIHLLIMNLIYDITQISLPWDDVDKEFLEKPRKWDASGLSKFMLYIGPVSSVYDLTTYYLMFFYFFGFVQDPETGKYINEGLFQAGWLVESMWSQTLVIHMIRTQKIPFIQSRASLPVILTTTIGVATVSLIPFTEFGASIGLSPLPASYWPFLVATIFAYCLQTQLVKMCFIRKFGNWL